MSLVFPSRVDGWIAAACLGPPVAALAALALRTHGNRTDVWIPFTALALVCVFCLWVLVSTYYEVTPDTLVIRSGPFSWRVPVRDITAIESSRSLASGPALSLDRIAVHYAAGRVILVSPRDKAGFAAAIHRLQHGPGHPHP